MLIKDLPTHLRLPDGGDLTTIPDFSPDSKYSYGLEIPHKLNVMQNNTMSAILKRTDHLNYGDEINDEYGWKAIVNEIIERRPAKGEWSNNPFDTKPDFVLFSYV